jgi:opacity protein-like surface antigen
MRVKFLYGLLASVAAGVGSAVAADMPVRPGPGVAPMAAPVYAPDWTGFYVGIHGGGGWGHESNDRAFFDSRETFPFSPFQEFFSIPNASPKGGVFGAQAGYNWQWGPVVGGLEIDFSWANIKENNTFFSNTTFFDPFYPAAAPFPAQRFFSRDFKIDELASARGRLGYLIYPNLLLYGTAGIGWGHTTMDEFERDTFTPTTPGSPFSPFFRSTTSSTNEFGWVAGAGLEWKFWNNWLLRGEWLHYDFGRMQHFGLVGPAFIPGSVAASTSFPEQVRTTVDVARAALSYKF